MTMPTEPLPQPSNGLPLSRGNRTRDRSIYDEEAAVAVGCSG